MAITLQELLQDEAAFINQDPALPTGTDLTMWTYLNNQSQKEWAVTFQWSQLKVPTGLSVNVSGTSLALPSNFNKMASPVYDMSQTTPIKYQEIRPHERYLKNTSDKYVVVFGNDITGYSLLINPPLASGASLVLDIMVSPSALATLADNLTCPSSQFIVTRTLAKILQARSDPRFPQMKSESDDLLAQMMEEETVPSLGKDGLTSNGYAMSNFRIGEQ